MASLGPLVSLPYEQNIPRNTVITYVCVYWKFSTSHNNTYSNAYIAYQHLIVASIITKHTCIGQDTLIIYFYMMMSWHGEHFHITDPLWGECASDRWFPFGSLKKTVESTVISPVIWDDMALIDLISYCSVTQSFQLCIEFLVNMTSI